MAEATLFEIVRGFGLEAVSFERIPSGLINRTHRFSDRSGAQYILQAVSSIFAPEVNDDIDVVTQHLAKKGLVTPLILRSTENATFLRDEGAVWRVMTYIPGATYERIPSIEAAHECGQMLARFHGALADLEHTFGARRVGVHDTTRHLDALERAISEETHHRLYDVVAPVADEINALARRRPRLPRVAERLVHGDPKISNLLFSMDGRALCMVDLDTVGPMQLPLELGDALRSWCNPSMRGEDDDAPEFSLPLLEAALSGYAARFTPSRQECEAIVSATLTIIIELSARFSTDALRESYFGWDSSRYASRGEHNWTRARGQLALARSLSSRLEEAQDIAARVFAGAAP